MTTSAHVTDTIREDDPEPDLVKTETAWLAAIVIVIVLGLSITTNTYHDLHGKSVIPWGILLAFGIAIPVLVAGVSHTAATLNVPWVFRGIVAAPAVAFMAYSANAGIATLAPQMQFGWSVLVSVTVDTTAINFLGILMYAAEMKKRHASWARRAGQRARATDIAPEPEPELVTDTVQADTIEPVTDTVPAPEPVTDTIGADTIGADTDIASKPEPELVTDTIGADTIGADTDIASKPEPELVTDAVEADTVEADTVEAVTVIAPEPVPVTVIAPEPVPVTDAPEPEADTDAPEPEADTDRVLVPTGPEAKATVVALSVPEAGGELAGTGAQPGGKLTNEQLAELAGVNVRTVYRWKQNNDPRFGELAAA